VTASRLATFGPPLAHTQAGTIPLPAERRFQLLAYLATEGRWVARERLLALFWPDHAPAAARRNLRRLLFDLRQLSWLDALEATGDSLRWAVDTDRRHFLGRCAAGDWRTAIALAAGPFLDGMENNATAPFAEWLRFERAALLGRWHDAVERGLEAASADPAAAEALARAVLLAEPTNESATLHLMRALEAQGRPEPARRAYEQYRARLAADLGVEPSARLRPPLLPAPAAAAAGPAGGRPDPHFVGRRLELRDLIALLRRADVRRVNVLGPGGVGKSTLAREALAAVAADFPHGAHWIDLRELDDLEQAGLRTAAVFGHEVAPGADPWPQVAERLGGARVLLVFDNCEHLPQFGAVTDALLARCEALTLLQTSRQRLGTRGEHVFPLAGLPVPDEDETELAAIRAYDAVNLFEKRALAADAGFELGGCVGDVVRLVRAYEGLPLAIELAAACLPVVPPAALVADFERSAALLDAVASARPAADALALRASFDRSWSTLRDGERRALARLALFAGDFDRAAAEHVAGAALPLLASLCDRSLVQARDEHRFALHPVVRQFARALLDDAAAAGRHAFHFGRLLAECTASAAPDRIRRIDRCLPDALAAWRWARRERSHAALLLLAEPLTTAFDLTGRWAEGLAQLDAALEEADDAGVAAETVRAELLRCAAMLHYRRGEFELAERRARESLRRMTALRRLRGAEMCLNLIGGVLRQRGEWDAAERFFERALRRAVAVGNRALAHRIGNNLATAEMGSGRTAAAVDRCDALLAQHRADGDPVAIAMTLIVLGNGLHALGREQEALGRYREGLQLAESHQLVTLRPFFLIALGSTFRRLGRVEEARGWYTRVLDCPPGTVEPNVAIDTRLGLARLDLAHDPVAAAARLQEALDLAARAASPGWLTHAVAACGEWFCARGQVERAAPLLAFAAASRAIDANHARTADAMLHRMLGDDGAAIERARAAAAALALDAVVAALRSDRTLQRGGPTPT
jgi:predicted ATPase/DNA-binding SARP family transcriptional activator